jgi:hypothetical protein
VFKAVDADTDANLYNVRTQAVDAFRRLGPKGVDALPHLLDLVEGPTESSWWALRAIRFVGVTSTVLDRIKTLLASSNDKTRLFWINANIEVGALTPELLARSMSDAYAGRLGR